MKRPRALPPLALVLLLVGCASSAPESTCTGATQAPLVNGSERERYLGLASEERASLALLRDAEDGSVCSAVLIAPRWLLTAAHCLRIARPEVLLSGEGGTPMTSIAIARTVEHPRLDIAAVELTDDAARLTGARPLRLATTPEDLPSIGATAELAGYGTTEHGSAGELRFLAEQVTALDAASLTVSGFGRSGACEGDSGGPLLVRGTNGAVTVAGVLSLGSTTCVKDDQFVRVDVVAEWLGDLLGPIESPPAPCGSIDALGRCFDGVAVWCDDGALSRERCAPGLACGFSRAQLGFRCVEAASDPCQGVDGLGQCVDGRASACLDGALVTRDCGCGACRIDPATAAPRCDDY